MTVNNSEIFDQYEEERLQARQPILEELPDEDEEDERQPCRIINSYKEEEGVGISLKQIFPDSNTFIVYESNNKIHYVGSIDKEILSWVDMVEYEPLLVTQHGILLAYKDSEGIQKYVYTDGLSVYPMKEPNYSFSGEDKMEVTIFTDEVDLTTSIASTERVDRSEYDTIFRDYPCDIYDYPGGQFVVSDVFVHYTDGMTVITLATRGVGSLFGYTLDVSEGNITTVLYDNFRLVNRLTLTVLLMIQCEDDIPHLMSARDNRLFELSLCSDASMDDIPIINGVPLLIKETQHGAFFTMFTPEMQEISIFNPRDAFSAREFGNGVYIKEERVLLLDIGALAFCQPVRKKSKVLLIRGKKYKTPVKHTGKLNELSSKDS